MKRPSFQFYPGDWLRSTDLRSCSVGARGLWIDMLCLMHEGTPYGYLKVGNKVIHLDNLARMIGATSHEVEGWLQELEKGDVYSRDADGCIYSRRMVRDEDTRQKRAAGGHLGGNPALKVKTKVDDKVNLNANLAPTPAVASAVASAKPTSLASSEKISLSAGFEWEGITEDRKALWAKAYPAVQIDSELAAAAAWAMENPANRKSNWGRFLTAWLKRSQDRAPAKGGGKAPVQLQMLACEFRGDPVNQQLEPCGASPARKGSFYGGRALCEHHTRLITDKSNEKTEMPSEVRAALNALVKKVAA